MKKIIFLFVFIWTCKSSQAINYDSVQTISLKSKYVAERNINIWLPKDYGKSTKKYAVLYMHDGQNLFDPKTSYGGKAWEVDKTIQRLLDENKIKDCIVVGVWNSPKRFFEYAPQKALQALNMEQLQKIAKIRMKDTENTKIEFLADNYLKFLTEELKPYIDKNYRTHKNQTNTYIAGSSMGGLISMYALCEYPKIFGGAACVSTHWSVLFDNENQEIPQSIRNYMQKKLPKAGKHKFYFDFGTATLDSLYEVHQNKVDIIMESKNYIREKNWTTRKFEGENHSEEAWQKRFDQIALFLLAK